jgi:hypothetical protein
MAKIRVKNIPPGNFLTPPPDKLSISYAEVPHALVPPVNAGELGELPCVEFTPFSTGAVAPNALRMAVPGHPSASIYYTMDGVTPTLASTKYNTSFPPYFPVGADILAFAGEPHYGDSPVTRYKMPEDAPLKLAAIGDWGNYLGSDAGLVWSLIRSKSPFSVLSVGDNTYNEADTPALRIQQDILNFAGPEIAAKLFFPVFGNHDWDVQGTVLTEMLKTFNYLPGVKRYWDLVFGHAHVFGLGTDQREPDLQYVNSSTSRYTSILGQWFQAKANASTSRWKIVISHDAPYTSETNNRPGNAWMRWPWDTNGVDLVLTGDSHVYERLVTTSGSTPIITTGWGGKDLRAFGTALNSGDGATSLVRYNSKFGAVFLTVSRNELKAEAYTVDNDKIDELILTKS